MDGLIPAALTKSVEVTSMFGLVTTYRNPDTDGVACAYAVAHYGNTIWGESYEVAFGGHLNGETRAALDDIGLPYPSFCLNEEFDWKSVERIMLVDTHHLAQLPSELPPERVIRVIDHHPLGDIERLPNAHITNVAVGAAATIVAEVLRSNRVRIESRIRTLLAAAIVSNTLSLRAPSTTDRDRSALVWLKEGVESAVDRIDQLMFEQRASFMQGDTESVVRSDLKVFEIEKFRVAIGQIEAPGASTLADRPDLNSALEAVRLSTESDFALINLADLSLAKSMIVFPGRAPGMDSHLRLSFANKNAAWADRILLRKTDLVPSIAAWGRDQSRGQKSASSST